MSGRKARNRVVTFWQSSAPSYPFWVALSNMLGAWRGGGHPRKKDEEEVEEEEKMLIECVV